MRTRASPRPLLLDTCALIWLANGDAMTADAIAAVDQAAMDGAVLVSPISAWEIGLLCRPRTGRSAALRFLPDARTWFTKAMSGVGIRPAPFTAEIAFEASLLPGQLHNDPADRLIISTARRLGAPVVTRDRRMIEYAGAGHLQVIAC